MSENVLFLQIEKLKKDFKEKENLKSDSLNNLSIHLPLENLQMPLVYENLKLKSTVFAQPKEASVLPLFWRAQKKNISEVETHPLIFNTRKIEEIFINELPENKSRPFYSGERRSSSTKPASSQEHFANISEAPSACGKIALCLGSAQVSLNSQLFQYPPGGSRTMKWGPPPSEISHLKLFPFLVLVYFACCSLGTPQVNKTVNDIAILPCGYNISTLELAKMRIYWQKQNDMVLSVINGQTKVWKKYENRTIPDFSNNHSIAILGLRLSDNGTYTCIIQKLNQVSYEVKHRANVKLLVKAYFHVPIIIDLGNPSPKIKRIQCSTSGGFPEPHLSWVENGEELTVANTTVSQDPETELYTISSELDFNATNSHSFMCLVKYGNLQVSQNFTWQISK
ncbi:T-lymphocyte activation antigen CD80 [Sorex fumeus]|uniref:T-lymphocyte activation antigen CD80 n=1 Tax=Sorex fumeus TaxID=62283 RepID=UPI0024ADB59D|nr:T-lymphocyte activation antigen CD80 [Sorex fumeus]